MAAFTPKIYDWKTGNYAVSAQVVGELCEKLEVKYGEVTRENFLDASREEDAPTHKLFEWHDHVAAEKYRLEQSRKIIGNLKITIISNDSDTPREMEVRAFPNVNPVDSNASYRSMEIAMSDVNLREQILIRALRELTIIQEKYATLKELAEVFEALAIVKKKVEDKKK